MCDEKDKEVIADQPEEPIVPTEIPAEEVLDSEPDTETTNSEGTPVESD